jgi:hypothetical protein
VTGVELRQQRREALEVCRLGVGRDVEVLRQSNHAVGIDCEASDDDVPHAGVVQSPEQLAPG